MSRTFVAIDLETTGLQPKSDAIIEIGAVKYRIPHSPEEDSVLESWSTLVNPQRTLSHRIQELTGIAQRELDEAPLVRHVLGPLSRFVGNLPVVGHNVAFDLGFLHKLDVLRENAAVDTFEMASILMPYAAGYSLGRLAEQLNLAFPTRHRALEDAAMTKELFLALFQRACQLDPPIIREINRLATSVNWPLRMIMAEVERSKARYAFVDASIGQQVQAQSKGSARSIHPAKHAEPPTTLEPTSRVVPLDETALVSSIENGGVFSSRLPGFEERAQQIHMLRVVSKAFNEQQHVMVEAGTGTGKSLAYLLPAMHFAVDNNRPVVISTNTINLQDQLIHKDLPDMKRILGASFEAVVLKGRTNYLCPRRLDNIKKSSDLTPRNMTTLAKILVWMGSTVTGDQSELTLIQQRGEFAFWRKVCVDADACQPEICRYEQGGRCFFYNARRQAEAAHLIVVNHALLMADMMTANRVLPEHHHLVIDEAHHLEDQATHQMSVALSQSKIEQLLQEISQPHGAGKYSGFLAMLLKSVEASKVPATAKSQIQDLVQLAQRETANFGPPLYTLFRVLQQFLDDQSPKRGSYDTQVRITPGLRAQPAWDQVEQIWEDLSIRLKRIAAALKQIYRPFETLESEKITGYADLLQTLAGYHEHVLEYRSHLNGMICEPAENTIYWANIRAKDGTLEIHTAPLYVGDMLASGLFGDKDTVVLTSATLQVDGNFSYMQDRLGLDDVQKARVGSPFNYAKSTLLYVPTNIPEPSTSGYARSVHQILIDLCGAIRGRTLVLFTSKSQLTAAYQAISETLGEAGITVLAQYHDGSRRQLLENFKKRSNTVLLGAQSFWEGVDVPGPALSCVVIARLPFPVPSAPVFVARSETYENPFMQFAVPQAVIRFRQGFGRLIRHKSDRGVAVVLDRRVLTKRYGQQFLQSLPECATRRGPTQDLPTVAVRWIENGEQFRSG